MKSAEKSMGKTLKKNVKIIVATHKEYPMPADAVYLPVLVGAAGKPPHFCQGMQRDDQGESISAKNAHYCELTGLYWAWKNIDADYLGLVHYRRHFAGGRVLAGMPAGALPPAPPSGISSLNPASDCVSPSQKNAYKRKAREMNARSAAIADKAFFEKQLAQCGVLLPKPRHYWIETNWSQYAHAHHQEDLLATRAAIAARCPDYLPAFDRVMRKRSGHRFNMLVMERSLLNAYCEWLFGLLFEVEKNLDISGYSQKDSRVFGYLSERLLDVWLLRNQIPYKEVPVLNLESQHWPKKVGQFLLRKIRR